MSEAVREHESESSSFQMEGASGDDHDEPSDQPTSKKRCHRHTLYQTQQMEMFFKQCPHPDEQQRQELGKELGLEPRQVKFWFQNRRTQMKAHHERADNSMLRAENERLLAENMALHEALRTSTCSQCGAAVGLLDGSSLDEQRLENARLKEELQKLSALVTSLSGLPVQQPSYGTRFFSSVPIQAPSMLQLATRGPALSDAEKRVAVEQALLAMEEFLVLAEAGEPLWRADGSLNQEEYERLFPKGAVAPSSSIEATKDTALVMMSPASLLDIIMQADKWADVFSSIVARAITTEVLTGASSNWNNALQMMYAELQVLSPLVLAREVLFLRYCRQAQSAWAIVDVSVPSLGGDVAGVSCCRFQPSGLLIEEVQHGFSKVTVVQHAEADDGKVNNLYREYVSSGMAFGATRWLATLQRQAERISFLHMTDVKGRSNMFKLAHRMTNNFCAGVGASSKQAWTALSGTDVLVTSRKSFNNPGEPPGTILCAATSLRLPVSHKRLFEFLSDERVRNEWDILSNTGTVQAVARISKGQDPGNVVSLLRVNAQSATSATTSDMLILQDSCTDVSSSTIVYAPVNMSAMNLVMQGEDPAQVALLPSGFAIFPGIPERLVTDSGSGSSIQTDSSLLTVAFQIIVPMAKMDLDSVTTVHNLISCTVQRIKLVISQR